VTCSVENSCLILSRILRQAIRNSMAERIEDDQCRALQAETFAARQGPRLNWKHSGKRRSMQRKPERMRHEDWKKRNVDRRKKRQNRND